MVHLFRSVDNSIIYVLIVQSEEGGYCYDDFLKSAPDSIGNGEFQRILGNIFKKLPHSLVCCKSLYNRENVILQCGQGSGGNLRCKVVCLTFPSPSNPLHSLNTTSKAHLWE